MKNPKIPALHFNTRFIVTSKEWFGGGMDATPSHKDLKESKIIHSELKKICLQNKKNYTKYKNWCDEYFFYLIEMKREESEVYFSITKLKIGSKTLNSSENLD